VITDGLKAVPFNSENLKGPALELVSKSQG
jgi:hypothetical protein